MIGESLHGGRKLFGFLVPPSVDISDRDELNIRHAQELFHQLLPAPARPNHA
jgi:hypothetical protein